jgi:hypothetical protein
VPGSLKNFREKDGTYPMDGTFYKRNVAMEGNIRKEISWNLLTPFLTEELGKCSCVKLQ